MIVTHCVLWTPKENASLGAFCGRWGIGYVPYASKASLRCRQNDFNIDTDELRLFYAQDDPSLLESDPFVSLKNRNRIGRRKVTVRVRSDSDDAQAERRVPRWHNHIMSPGRQSTLPLPRWIKKLVEKRTVFYQTWVTSRRSSRQCCLNEGARSYVYATSTISA